MPDVRWAAGVEAWLDWQLKGNVDAVKVFAGDKCALCGDPDWWVESRNIKSRD
jgi:hypothetical protein